jgi:hypothetical protein
VKEYVANKDDDELVESPTRSITTVKPVVRISTCFGIVKRICDALDGTKTAPEMSTGG